MRKKILASVLTVTLLASLGGTPAIAQEPQARTHVAQTAKLQADIAELDKLIPAMQRFASHHNIQPLLDAPQEPDAQATPIKDCTEGGVLTYADHLMGQLTDTEQAAALRLTFIVRFYAALVASDQDPKVFGTDGEYTARSTAAMDKLRGFWNIESWDISLIPLKGTDLANVDKMTAIFEFFDNSPSAAKAAAQDVLDILANTPALQYGRNPLLTLNAFSSAGDPQHGVAPRILLGDGILDVLNTLGFDTVSVETVLSHEYGHQNNFANNYSPKDESAEMSADAFGGYFVANPQGLGYDSRLQQEVTYLDAAIGDCQHSHGTPAQRKASGAWGESLATNQTRPDRIIPTANFIARWKEEYPMLNPHASSLHS